MVSAVDTTDSTALDNMESNSLAAIAAPDGSISKDAGKDDILSYLNIMSFKTTTTVTQTVTETTTVTALSADEQHAAELALTTV